MSEEFLFFVGIDWGRDRHQVCVLDPAGLTVARRWVDHTGEALAELGSWLLARCGCQPGAIAVTIEVPHGPIVETLLERGFAVFFVHPKQLDRFRDRYSAAGAKDDRRDALVAADAGRTDRARLRRLAVRHPLAIELGEWRRIADDLRTERGRLTNQFRAQLWRYFPQFLGLSDDLGALWVLDLWTLCPSPAAAMHLAEDAVAALLAKTHVRRCSAGQVVARLRQEPVIVAPGTVEAATAHCSSIIARLRLVCAQIKEADRTIDALLERWPGPTGAVAAPNDVDILRSLPGAGRMVVTTLVTEGAAMILARDYAALRLLSGVAPVTRQSGRSRFVAMRYACSRLLRDALFNWARVAIQLDPESRKRYAALRGKGHKHPRALRAIGDHLLCIACSMLKTGTLYDPERNRKEVTSAAI